MTDREADLTRIALDAIRQIELIVADLREHIIDNDPQANEAIRKAIESDDRQ